MVGLDSPTHKPEVTKMHHDCHHWYWQCWRRAETCPGFSEVEVIPPTPISKAGAATPVPKVKLNFFDDCGVAELAQKINLDLRHSKTISKESKKEPTTDTNNNTKEAIKTANSSKTLSRKEQLLSAKLKLLEKENSVRRQLLSQQAALGRAQHALKLRLQRTRLCTCHKFQLGSILSGNQPFIADAMAEVAQLPSPRLAQHFQITDVIK